MGKCFANYLATFMYDDGYNVFTIQTFVWNYSNDVTIEVNVLKKMVSMVGMKAL